MNSAARTERKLNLSLTMSEVLVDLCLNYSIPNNVQR